MSNPLETTATLAGTRDREKTADLLGQALAQGYLQVDEYDQRLQTVFQTHTAEELREITAGLPLDRIRRHDPRRRAARIAAARRGVRAHLYAYIAMCVIVLTVWAAVAVTTDGPTSGRSGPSSARASASSDTRCRSAPRLGVSAADASEQ